MSITVTCLDRFAAIAADNTDAMAAWYRARGSWGFIFWCRAGPCRHRSRRCIW